MKLFIGYLALFGFAQFCVLAQDKDPDKKAFGKKGTTTTKRFPIRITRSPDLGTDTARPNYHVIGPTIVNDTAASALDTGIASPDAFELLDNFTTSVNNETVENSTMTTFEMMDNSTDLQTMDNLTTFVPEFSSGPVPVEFDNSTDNATSTQELIDATSEGLLNATSGENTTDETRPWENNMTTESLETFTLEPGNKTENFTKDNSTITDELIQAVLGNETAIDNETDLIGNVTTISPMELDNTTLDIFDTNGTMNVTTGDPIIEVLELEGNETLNTTLGPEENITVAENYTTGFENATQVPDFNLTSTELPETNFTGDLIDELNETDSTVSMEWNMTTVEPAGNETEMGNWTTTELPWIGANFTEESNTTEIPVVSVVPEGGEDNDTTEIIGVVTDPTVGTTTATVTTTSEASTTSVGSTAANTTTTNTTTSSTSTTTTSTTTTTTTSTTEGQSSTSGPVDVPWSFKLQEKWNDELKQLDSPAAKKLTADLDADLEKTFKKVAKDSYEGYRITGYTKGSIQVEGKTQLSKPMDHAVFKRELQSELSEISSLGGHKVEGVLGARESPLKGSSAGLSGGAIAGIIILIVALIVLAVIGLIIFQQKRHRSHRLREDDYMVDDETIGITELNGMKRTSDPGLAETYELSEATNAPPAHFNPNFHRDSTLPAT